MLCPYYRYSGFVLLLLLPQEEKDAFTRKLGCAFDGFLHFEWICG
jgi:hypothetical protein